MVFGSIFMGFCWGELLEHVDSLKMEFLTDFDGQVFWSEFLNEDLERLRRFLMKWRLDLDSESCLELNGMIEIVG